jgi:aryl-alcohol dehydrogenase-like predicted oxidoreductase
METRRLGTTDLRVSVIGLGTMTWGSQNTEAEGHAQLDRALDLGINLIDAAEMYPVPPNGETFGRTEAIIGTWLAKRPGVRAKIVLATKVTGQMNALPHVRDGKGRLDRKTIAGALDASLKRLNTDYVDLYQTHSPDRAVNAFARLDYVHEPAKDGAAIEETLDALGDLVKAGKVRHIGVSNETPWGVMRHLTLAANGHPRIQSIQNPYSLLNRSFEVGLAEVAQREAVPLLTYSSLGMGVLAGKYLNGAWPRGCRLTMYERFRRYSGPRAEPAAAAYVALARRYGIDPAHLAYGFAASRPFVASVLVGNSQVAQLEHNVKALGVTLSPELLKDVNAIHAGNPNPCP